MLDARQQAQESNNNILPIIILKEDFEVEINLTLNDLVYVWERNREKKLDF